MTYSKPDFLCIGYEKSATTWLYDHLRRHPEIALPPKKEIRYFNEGEQIPPDNRLRRFTSGHWHYRLYQRTLLTQLRKWLSRPWDTASLSWYCRYLLPPHTDSWYAGLFDARRVSGDLTPTYTWLSPRKVSEIKRSFPHLKIIISLREPVGRVWSKVKMVLRHDGRRVVDATPAHIEEIVRNVQKQDPPYTDTLALWGRHFDHVLVLFFDDIVQNPQGVMTRVCRFLGCSVFELDADTLGKKSFEGPSGEIDPQLREALVAFYRPDVEALAQSAHGRHPQRWLDSYGGVQPSTTSSGP